MSNRTRRRWRADRDPLFRGDTASRVQRPVPTADPSVVRHILYLGGPGRATPYLSTTELRSVAEYFGGRRGTVWETRVPTWSTHRVKQLSQTDLSQMLRGKGKGLAKWSNAWEVARARVCVERWAEHLADFRALSGRSTADLDATVDELFEVASP